MLDLPLYIYHCMCPLEGDHQSVHLLADLAYFPCQASVLEALLMCSSSPYDVLSCVAESVLQGRDPN